MANKSGQDDFMAYQDQRDFSQNIKIRDLEERQRLLKDRILLVGENLISYREEMHKSLSELKATVQEMKEEIERIKDVVERLSEEIDTKARREDLNILKRQAKMFDPINLATIEDVRKMLRKSLINLEMCFSEYLKLLKIWEFH